MRGGLHRALHAIALMLATSSGVVQADVVEKTMRVGTTSVEYELVLPNGFDSSKTYPGVLGFSGGPQTLDTVRETVKAFYAAEAQQRGYIVVVPAAPQGELFFAGGEPIFPEFLQQILSSYQIERGKFHIIGPSNGGISAFYIASRYPQYFTSITAFPGYLPDANAARINAIAGMCIHMFVGSLDELGFGAPMEDNLTAFKKRGLSVTYSVEAGQPHRLRATLGAAHAARLFDQFDEDRTLPCGR